MRAPVEDVSVIDADVTGALIDSEFRVGGHPVDGETATLLRQSSMKSHANGPLHEWTRLVVLSERLQSRGGVNRSTVDASSSGSTGFLR